MRVLVYFDFKELNENEVVISKNRLKEILEEVYQAGYTDGSVNISPSRIIPWTPTPEPSIAYLNETLPKAPPIELRTETFSDITVTQ